MAKRQGAAAMEAQGYADAETIEAAKQGDMQAAFRLYQRNAAFIRKIALKYARIDCAVSLEDLEQSAFFAIVKAARNYDPERGSWGKVLSWALRSEFRGMFRRFHASPSLDKRTGEETESTLQEFVTNREQADGHTLQNDFRQSVRKMIKTQLDAEAAEIIEKCDLNGQRLQEIALQRGRSYAHTTKKRRFGLLSLAKAQEAKELYMDALELESRPFYRESAEECAMILIGQQKGYKQSGQ